MYLYFYVGEYAREAIEQTAGINTEMFNNKLDITSVQAQAPYLKTTYVNGTSGYNIWANGYCEQWSSTGNIAVGSTTKKVTYLKTFKDSNYVLTFGAFGAGYGGAEANFRCTAYDKSSVTFYNNSGTVTNYKWKACGYLAEGQY